MLPEGWRDNKIMDKGRILKLMLETKVIPLFYEGDIDIAKGLVSACYNGGARAIEFTNRGDKAKEVFAQLVPFCDENYPDLALGIGSIANSIQVKEFVDLGAHFLVSPFISEELAKASAEHDIFWTGGCATLSEMNRAYSWGVPLMKAFPGNVLGPQFIKAAKAPCPYFKIMPTGGVKPTEENLSTWFKAGASCVGMGSQLFVKNDKGEFDVERISELLTHSIAIAKKY